VGIVHVRRALARLRESELDHLTFQEGLRAPYYTPSGTPLLTQLSQFQENRQSMGLVVDEYGELLGLVTVEDVLEEIVGEFAGVNPLQRHSWAADEDGSYLVEGTASLRDLNRKLGMAFPLDGARTLNGLILECLEAMPEAGVTLKIADHPVEIVQMSGRQVRTARIHPAHPRAREPQTGRGAGF
jgi:Mg2+/Co2+ transporter CorB